MLPLLILVPLALLLLLNLLYSDAVRRLALPLTALLALAQSALVVFRSDWLLGSAEKLDCLKDLLTLRLGADSLSFVLLLATGLVVFTVALAAGTLVTDGRKQFNFLSVLLIALTGMNGIVLLQDIFTLYVFMEIISVASFILIAFNRDKGGLEGAFKYLILSAVASVLMIAGIALMMMLAGGTQFGMVHDALVKDSAFGLSRIAMAAFLCGLFIKSGLVPFHGWVPAAYSAAPAAGSITWGTQRSSAAWSYHSSRSPEWAACWVRS